jgi:rare lipoprotein A
MTGIICSIYFSTIFCQQQPKPIIDCGTASYYDYKLGGEKYSKEHDTCASLKYPRGSKLKVTNIENNKSVICRVNDYGPEKGQTPERIIDLSSHAFKQISNSKLGLITVRITKQ